MAASWLLLKEAVKRQAVDLEVQSPLGARSTRRLDVTPLGQSYYESALRLLGEVEQVEQGIAGQTAEPRGTIRLSAPLSFAVAHLGCLLPLFLQRHPLVSVEVDLSDRPVDLIGEGYDLALRIGALEDSSLIARRIASVERVATSNTSRVKRRLSTAATTEESAPTTEASVSEVQPFTNGIIIAAKMNSGSSPARSSLNFSARGIAATSSRDIAGANSGFIRQRITI